ncbi:hypothetical protein [Paenibacillus sp. S150]|uniref:hypothetical protein n=1 Tax=Paenibacillus sp. S150 TaxID=2749826 RepID=UPI001C58CC8C|nr:hypothetical protein [Paenibacillus sp. S150]MBW4081304.1 hypothetical protein [Paenibacillus sp. S150]
MGSSIVFWSPVPGQTGNTTNLIAVTAMLSLEFSFRLLLVSHVQSRRVPLEQGFIKRRTWEEQAFATDSGIDAVERLARNRKLSPEMIRDYTLPLLKDRLDLLTGSMKPDKAFVPAMKEALPTVLETAKRYYDWTLLDAGSGTGSGWTQALLQQADIIVVSLNQNRSVLERFFQRPPQEGEGKRQLLALGQYDPHSASTAKNLVRRYKGKGPFYPVSHNSGFMDAAQEGRAIDFLFRNRYVPRDHENAPFMRSVRALARVVSGQAGRDNPFFYGKEEKEQWSLS